MVPDEGWFGQRNKVHLLEKKTPKTLFFALCSTETLATQAKADILIFRLLLIQLQA